jgi:hypothetical protein
MTINKFSNNIPEKPFHSHTFAEAASGESMGATSAQSFGQRHQIDQNRRVVKRYSESSVASPGEHLKEELLRRIETSDPKHRHNKHNYRASRQAFNAGEAPTGSGSTGSKPLQVPKRNFSEPPGRKYNPFS